MVIVITRFINQDDMMGPVMYEFNLIQLKELIALLSMFEMAMASYFWVRFVFRDGCSKFKDCDAGYELLLSLL